MRNTFVCADHDEDESLRKKLNLLGTIDVMKWQNSNIRLRQPGTGVWFTESRDFKNWASADNSNLWVYGIRMSQFSLRCIK